MIFHSLLSSDGGAVIDPISISVPNGTAAGSIPFPSTIRAKRGAIWDDFAVTFDTTGYDSGTNGMYTLSGSLDDYGTPVSINVWVLPSPTQWAGFDSASLMTFGVDNLNRIVTAVTAKAGNNITQASANLVERPSWNGEGIFFNTQGCLTWGTTSSHATFHKDTNWSIFIVWHQLSMTTTYYGELIASNDVSGTGTGISIAVDNRSASSKSRSIQVWVTKGVSGQYPILLSSANDVVNELGYNWLEAKFDGTTFTLIVNGATAVTQVPSVAFATGDSSTAMEIGNPATFVSGGGLFGYLRHVYMDSTHVTGATETLLQNWCIAQCTETIPLESANVYLMAGQSNMGGVAPNGSIAAELDGKVGARIMVVQPTGPGQTAGSGSIDSSSYWEELELGVNPNYENAATAHGMEMRFGYEMWRYNKNCWIIKMGPGGTALVSNANNDWNASNTELFTKYNTLVRQGILEMLHIYRKTPVLRGFIWAHGESDALLAGAGAAYKANFTAMLNGMIDHFTITMGHTSKCRIIIFRVTDLGSPSYDATSYANVRTAQVDLGTNYLTDNPSYAGDEIRGTTWRTADDLAVIDTYHYDAASQDTLGMFCFNQLKPYIRE